MVKSHAQLSSVMESILSVDGAVFVLGKLSLIAAVGFAYELGNNIRPGSRIEIPEVQLQPLEESTTKSTPNTLDSYLVISSRNIFGAAPTPAPTQDKSEPVSNLKLRLVGTNVSSSGKPFAIIEETTKREQEVFDLNETVFTQAKLVEVLPESVKIERNGKIEVLVLEDDKSPSSTATSDSGVEPLNDDQTEFSVAESELEDALANLPRLLSQARAVPYFRNGKSVGMRLFAIRRDSLYEKLGLKNGDIVKAVNDNSLTDPAQALKLFEQLKNERSIKVQVERSGQDVPLSYSID